MLLIENIHNYNNIFYDNIYLPKHLYNKYNNQQTDKLKKIMKMSYYLKLKLVSILNLSNYKINYNIYKKPYITTEIFGKLKKIIEFNISHHDDLVILYYDKNKQVGIDILNINKEINYFQSEYFTDYENNHIKDKYSFYNVWLMKETYSKFLGKGLHSNLKNINFYTIINSNKSSNNNNKLKSKLKYKDIEFEFIDYQNKNDIYKICLCRNSNI